MYESKSLDHLGLIAGMYDDLAIGYTIDQLIEQDAKMRHLSLGNICKSLVIMGLGFTQRTLYMVSSFFEDRPVGHLLGEGITAQMLNDSVLGRGLDEIYEYGCTRLFSQLSPVICRKLGLEGRFLHLDSTSFHLDGRYNADHSPGEGSQTLHLTHGYSRDHRPDLNQVILNLIVENRAGIPLFMKAMDGNSNDKTSFFETVEGHIDQLDLDYQLDYLVMDSAGYTGEMLKLLTETGQGWISRVPENIGLCKDKVAIAHPEWQDILPGYQYAPFEETYAGVKQRWLLLFSAAAFEREIETLRKSHAKKTEQEYKLWQKLSGQAFDCEQDAQKAWERFRKKNQTLQMVQQTLRQKPCFDSPGRPARGAKPDRIEWYIEAEVSCSLAAYTEKARTKGRFIIATNELDTEKLSDADLLNGYKNQSKVERGFRFMKDPQFVASSFFVKKPERVEALLFIMTLCLSVYAAIEYKVREQLKKEKTTLPNQVQKEVQNPTARWIFSLFSGIHILHIQTGKTLVINIKPVHLKVLNLLGDPCKIYYQSSG